MFKNPSTTKDTKVHQGKPRLINFSGIPFVCTQQSHCCGHWLPRIRECGRARPAFPERNAAFGHRWCRRAHGYFVLPGVEHGKKVSESSDDPRFAEPTDYRVQCRTGRWACRSTWRGGQDRASQRIEV